LNEQGIGERETDMTNYRNGVRLEYKAMHELEKDGWYVIRAAGSHGIFDLVAFGKDEDLRLIQIKKTKRKNADIDMQFKNELKQMAEFNDMHRYDLPKKTWLELWVWKSNGKEWKKTTENWDEYLGGRTQAQGDKKC
jgi:Holliday junction resolvase